MRWNFTAALWKCLRWRGSLRKKGLGGFLHDYSFSLPFFGFFLWILPDPLYESLVRFLEEKTAYAYRPPGASHSDVILYLAFSNSSTFLVYIPEASASGMQILWGSVSLELLSLQRLGGNLLCDLSSLMGLRKVTFSPAFSCYKVGSDDF